MLYRPTCQINDKYMKLQTNECTEDHCSDIHMLTMDKECNIWSLLHEAALVPLVGVLMTAFYSATTVEYHATVIRHGIPSRYINCTKKRPPPLSIKLSITSNII